MAAKTGIKLGTRFEAALAFAAQKHEGQYRKGNRAPYISHPMAVAALVMEMGGSEPQAIAALLHDVIEDCNVTSAEISEKFGAEIASLVVNCTEKLDKASYSWRERKISYLSQIRSAPNEALLVVICDKFHNLSSLVADLKFRGDSAWKIFTAPPADIRWYYGELVAAFSQRPEFLVNRVSALHTQFKGLVDFISVEAISKMDPTAKS